MSSGPATMSVLSAPLATENPITCGELSVVSQEIEIILIDNNNINMFFILIDYKFKLNVVITILKLLYYFFKF
jgi:hypothetical protein